jgi:hypothetical protein
MYREPSQADSFRHVPGSSSYRCVRVGHYHDVRSGDFMAGPLGVDEQMFAGFYQRDGQRTEV